MPSPAYTRSVLSSEASPHYTALLPRLRHRRPSLKARIPVAKSITMMWVNTCWPCCDLCLSNGPREPGQPSAPRAASTGRLGDRGPWKLLRLRDDQLPSHDGGAARRRENAKFREHPDLARPGRTCNRRKQQSDTTYTTYLASRAPYLASSPELETSFGLVFIPACSDGCHFRPSRPDPARQCSTSAPGSAATRRVHRLCLEKTSNWWILTGRPGTKPDA